MYVALKAMEIGYYGVQAVSKQLEFILYDGKKRICQKGGGRKKLCE
jgi:hypothetical protein